MLKAKVPDRVFYFVTVGLLVATGELLIKGFLGFIFLMSGDR